MRILLEFHRAVTGRHERKSASRRPIKTGARRYTIDIYVLDRIGSKLDQWSDMSLFDTDILSAKAREAGFTLCCCRDLFIHHFGTRTFGTGPPAISRPMQADDDYQKSVFQLSHCEFCSSAI